MIKKSITFENFEGDKVTEDHYFHLSMRELTQMELSTDGGMHDKLQAMLNSGNGSAILKIFEDLVSQAYGQREDNNPNSFLKSPEISERFMNSLAYDALFSSLMRDGNAMATFINGLIPADLQNMPEMKKAMEEARNTANGGTVNLSLPADDGPLELTHDALVATSGLAHPNDPKGNVWPWAYREPTSSEIQRMNRQQLAEAMQRKSKGWTPQG